MDLNTVEAVLTPSSRGELWPMGAGDAVLAGGTYLFSEPHIGIRRLIDLTRLGWPSIVLADNGIELAATCTIAEVSRIAAELPPQWRAAPLFGQCCTALLASYKVWESATVGGNLCLAFPAGSMISLLSALDGQVLVWRPDGTDRRIAISDFVVGDCATALMPGEVVRSVWVPASALRGHTAFRKLAIAPLGRSGVVVIGRRDTPADGDRFVLSVTAATVRPYVFAFPAVPDTAAVRAAHASIPDDAWTRDAHGDPDWRRAMTLLLAEQAVEDLR
jgi:CO/xanthine dehydrogenase FAD-binding subunit